MSFRNLDEDHKQCCLRLLKDHKTVTKEVNVTGNDLTIPQVFEVSRSNKVQVRLNENDGPEKGMVANGVGEKATDPKRIYRVGIGRSLPVEAVRSGMLVRANHNAASEAGVREQAMQLLTEMLNLNIIPQVPERGSTSSTGDVTQMSYIAACLAGQSDVRVCDNGTIKTAAQALKEANLKPVELTPNETISFINSESITTGIAACAVFEANLVAMLTQVTTGMAVEALHGRTESFHPILHDCLPHIGQKEMGRNMTGILKNTNIAISILDMYIPDTPGKLKQDRYSLRSAPQWLSPVLETLTLSVKRIEIQLNSSTECPVSTNTNEILYGGNAQALMMAITMDQTRQALQICGRLIFAQFQEIVNDKLNYGLPHNLAGSDPKNDSGFLGLDIAMASYMTELDHTTNPTSNHIQGSESHNQSTNSMALFSARLTLRALELIQMMVASHMCLLAQAVDLRWLSFRVKEILEARVEKSPAITRLIAKHRWWDFVYDVETTCNQVANALPEDERETFITSLAVDLKNVMETVVASPEKVQKDMGEGSGQLYGFVRRQLQVSFNRGEKALDGDIQKILDSIQTLDVEDTLLNIFQQL